MCESMYSIKINVNDERRGTNQTVRSLSLTQRKYVFNLKVCPVMKYIWI